MLMELLLPLVKDITFFNIFQYVSFRSAMASLTAFLIIMITGPRIIELLRKFKVGQVIRQEGPSSHLVKAGVPTMGGLLIVMALLVSILLWQNFESFYTWLLLFVIITFGFLGFLDDYLKISRKSSDGLRAWFKLLGQVILATVVMILIYKNSNEYTTLLYVPFIKNPIMDLRIFYIPFGILLLVGTSNAFNIVDGCDGLLSGLILIALIPLGIITYLLERVEFAEYLYLPHLPGISEMSIVVLSLLGATLGFLWFNSHPAQVIMGDTGSISYGAIIGTIALVLKKEILLIIIGGVFVLETLSVIIQVLHYKRTGKRVFKMAPLHHHFEESGWEESKVVIRFWILGVIFALLALVSLKMR